MFYLPRPHDLQGQNSFLSPFTFFTSQNHLCPGPLLPLVAPALRRLVLPAACSPASAVVCHGGDPSACLCPPLCRMRQTVIQSLWERLGPIFLSPHYPLDSLRGQLRSNSVSSCACVCLGTCAHGVPGLCLSFTYSFFSLFAQCRRSV